MDEPGDEQRFVQAVSLQVPPETVWETLVDPQALSWMVVGCSYTTVAPRQPGAKAELRCWWSRCGYRSVASGVFQVVTVEPYRRLRYLELTSRPLHFEIGLEPQNGGSRVEITGMWSGFANESATKKLVKLWARKLPAAVAAGPIPAPPSPLHLLDGLGYRPRESARGVHICASLDAIWAAANDPVVLNNPALVRTWTTNIDAAEVRFSIVQRDGGRAIAGLTELTRQGQHHQTSRSLVLHEEQRLVPEGAGGRLTAVARWSRRRPLKQATVDLLVSNWLSKVKAAAEQAS